VVFEIQDVTLRSNTASSGGPRVHKHQTIIRKEYSGGVEWGMWRKPHRSNESRIKNCFALLCVYSLREVNEVGVGLSKIIRICPRADYNCIGDFISVSNLMTGSTFAMNALSQNRSIRDDASPVETDSEAMARPVRLNMERSNERSLLIIDSRSLDGQSLAGCISARKNGMDAVWFSSMSDWRRKQTPRHFAAILLNIGGKDITDPAVAAEIRSVTFATDVPTIVMSDSENLVHIVRALELGAKGYIPTSVSLDVCIEAIALSMVGGVFMPANSVLAMRQRLCSEKNVVRPLNDMFTVRQAQVVERLRCGKANKIIAYELNMQESTVKVHIRSIMKKVKATNRTEVAYKLENMFPRERSFQEDAEKPSGASPT
jgi:DNA-binding NarL/FixJ family response regulator